MMHRSYAPYLEIIRSSKLSKNKNKEQVLYTLRKELFIRFACYYVFLDNQVLVATSMHELWHEVSYIKCKYRSQRWNTLNTPRYT